MLSTCIVYSPCVGDIYPSFDEAWYKLCTFSHRSRGSLRTQRRDTSCLHLVCIDRRCNFEAFVSFARQKDSPIKTYHLKRLLPIHICSGAEHTPRGSMHNIKFIRRTVSEGMPVNHNTTPALIQEWYRDRHGPCSYKTAQRIRTSLLGNAQAIQAEQFTLLPAYVERILAQDPGALAKLRLDPSCRFANLFVCPSSSRSAWKHMRPFIALDAAFTKVIHHYVLLVAVGQDANNETIALAWGVAPVENYDHWGWFIENLNDALGSLNNRKTVLMSDRQKGLNLAISRLLPQATEAYCCKHIERNIEALCKVDVSAKFWAVVRACNHAEFMERMEQLREHSPKAATELSTIPQQFWADYAFPSMRYGQRTSNLVEQQNNVYRQAREKPILDMLQHIWDDAMEKRCVREEKASKVASVLSTWANNKKREEQDDSRVYRSRRSSNMAARVFSSRDHHDEYVVTLDGIGQGTCSCGAFQNDLRPCRHAWAFLDNLQQDGTRYFASFYQTSSWNATYQQPLPPIIVTSLAPDPLVLPPKIKVQRGRREKKRKEAGTRGSTQRIDPEDSRPVKRKQIGERQQGTGVWGGRWEYKVVSVDGASVAVATGSMINASGTRHSTRLTGQTPSL